MSRVRCASSSTKAQPVLSAGNRRGASTASPTSPSRKTRSMTSATPRASSNSTHCACALLPGAAISSSAQVGTPCCLTPIGGFGRLVGVTSSGGSDDAMTKSELVQRLADTNPHLYQRDIEVIVTAIFDEIAAALARGDRVELRGFGAFSVKHRDARIGRNPRSE